MPVVSPTPASLSTPPAATTPSSLGAALDRPGPGSGEARQLRARLRWRHHRRRLRPVAAAALGALTATALWWAQGPPGPDPGPPTSPTTTLWPMPPTPPSSPEPPGPAPAPDASTTVPGAIQALSEPNLRAVALAPPVAALPIASGDQVELIGVMVGPDGTVAAQSLTGPVTVLSVSAGVVVVAVPTDQVASVLESQAQGTVELVGLP